MKQQFYGWKLLAVLSLIQAFVMGFTAYGGSIMNTYMITELQLDRKSLGFATGSFGLCMGLFSPLTGFCVHRRGARTILAVGTLTATLGALAMATIVDTLPGVVIVFGVIMGCAAALSGGIPTQTVASQWFRKRLALAFTILGIGATIGGFVATSLLTRVIVASNGNWRAGWFVVAAVCAVSFLFAILFVRNKPADLGQVQDGVVRDEAHADPRTGLPAASSVYRTTEDWTYREALRHPGFWVMIFGVVIATSITGMMITHGVAHFKDLGYSPAMAAMFLSLLIFAGLGGKAIFATLGDRIEPRFLWGASLIFVAIGLALGVKATSATELYASAILMGAGPSVATLAMFTLAVNYYGKAAFAPLTGVIGLFLTLVPSVVVVLTGIVFDRSGSYTVAFYAAALICTLGGLVMPFVAPPKRACRS